ncbi:MAG TPA: hypothetical protein VFQ76_00640 [Longimicrobiaceae bacterium]|nr:hypothetical protein [Longimicrobiaceae bacterium]
MKRQVLLLLLVPFLSGCGDESLLAPFLSDCRDKSLPQPPRRSASAISDGAQPGPEHNPHFFFLPPLAPHPAARGTFNPRLRPWVSICEWASGACVPSGLHRRIDATRPSGGDAHYQADWHTQAQPRPASAPAVYRLRVMVAVGADSLELGFADVQFHPEGKSAKRAVDEGAVGLVGGRSLPIKFRVEEGALAAGCEGDCAEGTALPGGSLALVTSSGYAATFIGPGAIPPEVGAVSVLIASRQHSTPADCLPFPAQQAAGCYRFETIPALPDGFLEPVRVEVCLDPDAWPAEDYRLHKLSVVGPAGERGRVVALTPVVSSLVDCTEFEGSGPIGVAALLRPVLRGWNALAAPVARLLGPAPLYAKDIRYGGMTNSFSEVGYARLLGLGMVCGAGQTAPAGATLPVPPRVQLLQGRADPDHDPPLTPGPVAGARVRFRVLLGGGKLAGVDSLDVFTDAAGQASVPWTLGSAAGPQGVVAYVPGTGAPPVTFTATAVAP